MELKYSLLGITAFTLTIIADFILILASITKTPGIATALYWIFTIIATVLAIIDLTKPDRNKALSKLSLGFGIGIIITLGILSALFIFTSKILFK